MGSEHAQLTHCPNCGHVFDPLVIPPLRKRHRMVWSNRLERYVRKLMSDHEWEKYDQKGSVD